MATKDITLKRKLIKECIVCAAVLIALAGGGMLLSNYDDDAQSEKRIKQGENDTIRSQHDAIQLELGTGFQVSAFYEAYIKARNGNLLIKRDIAMQDMTTLREKNHLTNLSVTISPVSDVTTPDFGPIKSGMLTKSEVHLTFGAVTDNSVYGFIESLERTLPGIIVMQDIKLTRAGDPSRDMLVGLSQHRLMPLVTGELIFTWLGIRPTEEDKSGSTGKGTDHGS